ncbi:MAG: PIN-like domain-containing protein [Alistipes indistinctus]
MNDVWDKGIFCYDANVLLNLYRYSNETRNKIFENIEYFIGKTIMPYQACYEYHKNRRGVEDSLLSSYDEIIKIIEQAANALESGDLAKYRKHCALDIDRDIIKPIKSATTKIVNKIKDTKSNHSSFLNVSEIHEKISQLFDGKISDKFSEDELKRIYTEGKSRYDKKIPPGFADYDNKKNKGENSLYGDLIIWKHLIEISKSKNSDIIFVTDDRKKDWWDIHHGQTKGALPELYREFKELTSHNILIYSVEDYMKYAPEHSEIAVPKKVINEIEELRKVDERRKNYIDLVSYNDIIEKVNMKTKLLDISEKYKEILKSFNHQNPITDYSKSYQEISKAMDKFNYNTQYLELIKSISELDQSKVLQLQKKLGMINKHNAEDDE